MYHAYCVVMSAMEEDTLLDSDSETRKQHPVDMTTLMQAVSSKLDKLDSTSGILDAMEIRRHSGRRLYYLSK